MKKILLLILVIALFLVGGVSAYGIYLSCPNQILPGQPIRCSVNTDYPPGTAFNLVFYQSQYTSTQIDSKAAVVQGINSTQYFTFSTMGLAGGQYKVEVQFNGPYTQPRTGSIMGQIVQIIDRSSDITITSPMTQTTGSLLISGSIANEGKTGNYNGQGIQLTVSGMSTGQVVFGPQYIQTTQTSTTTVSFSQQVTVTQPGDYNAQFNDTNGYIGVVTFHVTLPATAPTAPTTLVTTITLPTTTMQTTAPTTVPVPTKSPLPVEIVAGALGICIVISSKVRKKQR